MVKKKTIFMKTNLFLRLGDQFGLGSFRLFLAFLVAFSHLWKSMPQGYAAYAVWGFFVLSGYLMTYVLKHKYYLGEQSIYNYIFNRGIRIIPAYAAALILGIATIKLIHNTEALKSLNPSFMMPVNLVNWLNVITLLPVFPINGLPVPVSHALSVEVGYYLLMPLFASHKSTAWLALIIGIFLNCDYGLTTATFPVRYSAFLPCLLPFAVGSILCHYKDQLGLLASPKMSLLFWNLHGLVWFFESAWPWTYGLYVSILLSAWVVISLVPKKAGKIDTMLGDLSYPMYLFHTTVAAWFMLYFGTSRTLTFCCISVVATILTSIYVLTFVEIPLRSLKTKPLPCT